MKTVTQDAPAGDPGTVDPTDDGGSSTDPTDSGGSTDPDAAKGDPKPDGGTTGPGCTPTRWYVDADGDGFGAAATHVDACTQPTGYVADDTDCDDTRASVNPKAVELCDAIDNSCSGGVNGTADQAAACTAKIGSYAGTFSLVTQEKVGATVVNSMTCTGTTTITVDLSASTVVSGPVVCTYTGGLTAFDHDQSGTIAATVRPDGTLGGVPSSRPAIARHKQVG